MSIPSVHRTIEDSIWRDSYVDLLVEGFANTVSNKADEEKTADIDHHKNDQLKKQNEGKGHWKRELGSNSESAVHMICSVRDNSLNSLFGETDQSGQT